MLRDAWERNACASRACLFHCAVYHQLSAGTRRRIEQRLLATSTRRPVVRLAMEGGPEGAMTITLYSYHAGERTEERLARVQPHGAWLEWVGAPVD